jgi:hypothetical protein
MRGQAVRSHPRSPPAGSPRAAAGLRLPGPAASDATREPFRHCACSGRRATGLQYLVLGPVTDDPKQIDLMAKKVVKHFK